MCEKIVCFTQKTFYYSLYIKYIILIYVFLKKCNIIFKIKFATIFIMNKYIRYNNNTNTAQKKKNLN